MREKLSAGRVHCVVAVAVIAASLLGCGDAPVQSGRGTDGTGASAPAVPPKATVAQLQGLALKDDDFVESERHRDPFRSFSFAPHKNSTEEVVPDTQRPVIMPDTNVEDMRLIAVVSGLDRPKAMLVDAQQVGYVVQRGDYIGKPKVFQSAGSVAMTMNWRVDRIRENEVVLTRQDPSDLGRPPISRIISMRDEVATR